MKNIVVSFKKAAFGWPFYASWNFMAYAIERESWAAKGKSLMLGMIVVTLTTAAWAALWLAIAWLLMRLVSPLLVFV